jgi:hypothetical protein
VTFKEIKLSSLRLEPLSEYTDVRGKQSVNPTIPYSRTSQKGALISVRVYQLLRNFDAHPAYMYELNYILYPTAPRPALGLTKHLVQYVPRAPSPPPPAIKHPVCEADSTFPFTHEVMNGGDISSLPPYIFMVLFLIMRRGNFTFTL